MAKEKGNRKNKKKKSDIHEKKTEKKRLKQVKIHGNVSFRLIRLALIVGRFWQFML